MRRLLASLAFCSIASAPLEAQWTHEGKVVPDEPWRKSAGTFGAMLLLTDKAEAFFEAWDRPASPDHQPSISVTTEAHRGDTVTAVVMFLSCRADAKGLCDLEADFKVLSPDGSVYGEVKAAPLWKGRPPGPAGVIQRGEGALALNIEESDPFGEYRVEVVVRDKVVPVEIALLQKLTVEAAKPAP